jgi:biopolymer transport protein ExbD
MPVMKLKMRPPMSSYFWSNANMRVPLPQNRRRARIEIIPLIDIVFFLLATFVMVSLSMVQNKGIKVNLPQAVTAKTNDEKTHVTVTVDEEGHIYVDKEQMTIEGMKSHLQRLKSKENDLHVLINGDDKAYFGTAVTVLDEIRALGISKVAIQTKLKNK